jgi:WD40 repeat protein
MALRITCPACAAPFTPVNDLRGKKAFCPSCGQAFVVTGAGVAKRNEERRPAPSGSRPWLLLVALVAALVLLSGGLALYLFTRGQDDEAQQVVKNEDQPPPPAPKHQDPSDDPSAAQKKERDPNKEQPQEAAKIRPENTPTVKPSSPGPQTFRVRRIAYLPTKAFQAFSLAFSPDGKRLAAGGQFYSKPPQFQVQIRLWDVANQKNTKTLDVQTNIGRGGLSCGVAFSPDGKTLVSAETTATGEVTLWDVATGKSINTFNSPYQLGSLALSRDGKTVAAGGQNGPQLWDIRTGKATMLSATSSIMSASVAFSPDSATLASLASDGKSWKICLWNLAEGKKTAALTTASKVVHGLAFSSDGKTVLAVGSDGTGKARTIEAWEVASRKKTSTFAIDGKPIGTTDYNRLWVFSPDGTMLATPGDSPNTITLWDVASGKELAELGHGEPVMAVAFSRDGTRVATSTGNLQPDFHIYIWELTGRRIPSAEPERTQNASPPPKAEETRPVKPVEPVKPIQPAKPVAPVPDKPFFDTRCMALSRDGKTLATAGLGSDIRLWDLGSGKNVRTIRFDTGYPHMPAFLAFSPDGKTLAIGSWGATNAPGHPFWLYDVASGKHTTTLQGGTGAMASLSFSPDGKRLLAGQGRGIATWDVASGQARIVSPTQSPDSFYAYAGALRPDGRMLATAGMSQGDAAPTIKAWDTASGRLIGGLNSFSSLHGVKGAVAFSPDGKTLLWGGSNELRLFDFASGKTLASYTDDKNAAIVSVAFSPDGKTAATGGGGNPAELKLWNLTSGKATMLGRQANLNSLHTIFSMVFTPDGKTLISQSLSEVKLWDVASGKCVRTLEK